MARVFDLAVIGGGINGVGIARDAAGRGLSVYLCEMNDLASGTSSRSTKLIHGGLRYLEQLEFKLVREALLEREVLCQMAPHIVRPMRFVLPHRKGMRPAWVLRLGLCLYDRLGGRWLLDETRALDLTCDQLGAPLKQGSFTRGFEYSDCSVDDARLVVLNARDAATRGAVIETRTKAVSADRSNAGWTIDLQNQMTGKFDAISARALVNASGPWVTEVLSTAKQSRPRSTVRLVQGSHIVVRRLYDHDRSYIFQNIDGRIVFVIPYLREFTLIGTTDRDYDGDPSLVCVTDEEIEYLGRTVSDYFETPVTRDDIVWTFSGVRSLYDDGVDAAQSVTRDYVLELDEAVSTAPLLSIFGGKITIYRKLAEAALEKLSAYFPNATGCWTHKSHLPGGDFPVNEFDDVRSALGSRYPFLSERTERRLVASYGTDAFRVLGDARSAEELGCDFGAGLTEAEVNYLITKEWAIDPTDILWRRSKLGLFVEPGEVDALGEFMARRSTGRTT